MVAAESSLKLDDVYGCDVLTECDLGIAVDYRHSLLFARDFERSRGGGEI